MRQQSVLEQGALEKGRVDWPSFLTCVTIVLLVSLPLLIFPEAGERLLTASYDFIADRLGFLYALSLIHISEPTRPY